MPWDAASDARSQASWQVAIGGALRADGDRIIQASNSLQDPPEWGAAALIRNQNATAIRYISVFSHHNYPGAKNVADLMRHENVARNVKKFTSDIYAAKSIGRDYVFGETNSGVSNTLN
jgi:hypothetical protein